jgi:hypothetical protein
MSRGKVERSRGRVNRNGARGSRMGRSGVDSTGVSRDRGECKR